MKTNVPFQAPGINAPPRGKGQLQGTSPLEVGKNVKKTIKEQFCELNAHTVKACDRVTLAPCSLYGTACALLTPGTTQSGTAIE
jgi:hypothetical protein